MSRSISRLLVPTLVLVSLWAVLAWWPTRSSADEAHLRLDLALSDQLAFVDDLTEGRGLDEDTIENRRDELRRIIPDEPEIGPFLRTLGQAGDESGVIVDLVTPTGVMNSATSEASDLPLGISAISLSIGASGSYEGLVEFMGRLDRSTRLTAIDSLSMTAADEDASFIVLDLEVRVFTTADLSGPDELDLEDEFDLLDLDEEGAEQ